MAPLHGAAMIGRSFVLMLMLGFAHSADAHGIAGNCFFPGRLSFDDPAVADEAIIPNFASSKRPAEGGDVVDNRYSWSLFRLLTKTVGVGIDSGWVHRDWIGRPNGAYSCRISCATD